MSVSQRIGRRSAGTTNEQLGSVDPALLEKDELSPATDVAASGALIEPEIVSRIDTSHPAVDDRPREGMPVIANRIDFNDPHQSGADAVAEALGQKTHAEAEAEAAEAEAGKAQAKD